MITAYQFFLKHAGFSYTPGKETKAQGRARCARELAKAEKVTRDLGASFQWLPDTIDSSDFSDDTPPYQLWICIARDANGVSRGSLSGIDFGRDGEPWGDPYRRVVEAELAQDFDEVFISPA